MCSSARLRRIGYQAKCLSLALTGHQLVLHLPRSCLRDLLWFSSSSGSQASVACIRLNDAVLNGNPRARCIVMRSLVYHTEVLVSMAMPNWVGATSVIDSSVTGRRRRSTLSKESWVKKNPLVPTKGNTRMVGVQASDRTIRVVVPDEFDQDGSRVSDGSYFFTVIMKACSSV